jgi:hypothetical protein
MIEPSIFDAPASALLEANFDAELLATVLAHWHETFMAAPQRGELLTELGLRVKDAIALNIGLSDRSLGLRIPSRQLKSGRLLRARLEALGIFRESGHEAFRGCLVVPVRNEGAVVAIYSHRLDDPRVVHWASGLPGGVFEATVSSGTIVRSSDEIPCTRCVVTTSVPDALAVYGALARSADELPDTRITVLAPARPKGYATGDLRALARRSDQLTLLGRGAESLASRLITFGATPAHVRELDLARTLTNAASPAVALAALLGEDVLPSPGPSTFQPALERDDEVGVKEVHDVDSSVVTVDVMTSDQSSVAPPGVDKSMTVTRSFERDEVHVHFASRAWRVRGARARANVEGDRLNVALSVSDLATGHFHLDTLDLYTARARASFLDAASLELVGDRVALTHELSLVLSVAEETRDIPMEVPDVGMTSEERAEALAWLSDPDLVARLRNDLSSLGVVGEATNLLVCFLAALSRKCERPFGVLVQSSSAGGKTTLVDAVTSLVPPEDLVAVSAMTSQALYYLGGSGLRHKVLSIAEEHGSSRASYALKLLVSEGRLSIASTGKDAATGRLATKHYETSGPLSLLMTTTATTIDPELENRLVVLGVNEDPAQTEAIIAAQRRAASLAGLTSPLERDRLRALHQNVQRLLEPLPVVIPETPTSFPTGATRHRRDHAKFLSMIAAVTLLHQHQRERRQVAVGNNEVTYLEATEEDVTLAATLARETLARAGETLAPQTRRLLACLRTRACDTARINNCTPEEVDVTRRELREWLGWSDTQVRAATDRLVALEYLVVSGGGRGRCRTYRLVAGFDAVITHETRDQAHECESRHVRSAVLRTSNPLAPGKSDQFVGFVPFAYDDEHPLAHATSYPEVPYREIPTGSESSKGER